MISSNSGFDVRRNILDNRPGVLFAITEDSFVPEFPHTVKNRLNKMEEKVAGFIIGNTKLKKEHKHTIRDESAGKEKR